MKMAKGKLGSELQLLLTLCDNRWHSVNELAEMMQSTTRNVYYYLEYLRSSGFIVEKQDTTYRVSRQSKFFSSLHEIISLTKPEAEYICRKLSSNKKNDAIANNIIGKLERYFQIEGKTSTEAVKRINHNLELIEKAIEQQKIVIIKDYSSPHSRTKKDRLVEPFMVLDSGADVRCFEINTHMNKTFKLSRMADVVITEVEWLNQSKHKDFFTDIFMFSGEEKHHVVLKLGQLAKNLLIEENRMAEQYITPIDDDHWQFETDVASYLGIGRFILGLYDDIEITGDEGLRNYIKEKVESMYKSVSKG